MWSNNARDQSLNFLHTFSSTLRKDLEMQLSERAPRPGAVARQRLDEMQRLAARCFFKEGQWRDALKETWTDVSFSCFVHDNLLTIRKDRHSRYFGLL